MQSVYKMILSGGIRDVVQLVDYLLTMSKDLSSKPLHSMGMVVHTCNVRTQTRKQENQKLKVILSCTVSLKPA